MRQESLAPNVVHVSSLSALGWRCHRSLVTLAARRNVDIHQMPDRSWTGTSASRSCAERAGDCAQLGSRSGWLPSAGDRALLLGKKIPPRRHVRKRWINCSVQTACRAMTDMRFCLTLRNSMGCFKDCMLSCSVRSVFATSRAFSVSRPRVAVAAGVSNHSSDSASSVARVRASNSRRGPVAGSSGRLHFFVEALRPDWLY